MHKDYILESASELGREQLSYLESLFDASTTAFLESTGVQSGLRCLDLGSGNGSIANWLAARVGPTGKVVATDIDTDQLTTRPAVQILQHDVNEGIPPGGPFDLIHARFVLMHLPRREHILSGLVDALAPGGWLVLGDSVDRSQEVLSAPGEEDEKLVRRVVDAGLHVTRGAGGSWEWAYETDQRMAQAGLVNIAGLEYCPTITGGASGGLLYSNYATQTEWRLLDVGITRDELRRFHALMRDPQFRARPFIQLVFTRGQKPVV